MISQAHKSQQKTIMGLLSYLPGLRELPHLQDEMTWYAETRDRQFWLWRRPDHQQTQGVLGVEYLPHDIILVRHVALTPDARTAPNYFALLSDFYRENRTAFLMGTLDNQKLIDQWRKHYYRD